MSPDCKDQGIFYSGTQVGPTKRWGLACDTHEKQMAAENVKRYEEDKGWRSLPRLAAR